VDPRLVAAALSDRSYACELLKGRGVREGLSALAKGHQKARGKCRASAGQLAEELVVGQSGAETTDLLIEALDGGAGGSKLR
jgi:hypothetical protein